MYVLSQFPWFRSLAWFAGYSDSDSVTRLPWKCGPGLQSSDIRRLNWEGSTSTFTHAIVGRSQSLANYWTETSLLHELLARGLFWSFAMWACPQSISQHGTVFIRGSRGEDKKEYQQECTNKRVFCFLIKGVAYHYLHCVLFTRSKSLGTAHTKERGVIQGWKYQEEDSIGSHVSSCLPHLTRQRGTDGSKKKRMKCWKERMRRRRGRRNSNKDNKGRGVNHQTLFGHLLCLL